MAKPSKFGKDGPSQDMWINPASNFRRESGKSEWEGRVARNSRKLDFADLAVEVKAPAGKKNAVAVTGDLSRKTKR